MAEDYAALAQLRSRGGDPLRESFAAEVPVGLRDVVLPVGEGVLLGKGSGLERAVDGALVGLVEHVDLVDDRSFG